MICPQTNIGVNVAKFIAINPGYVNIDMCVRTYEQAPQRKQRQKMTYYNYSRNK
jgi:hypothetical protein